MPGSTSATFKGDAWFNSATFKGDAWFHSATFKGDAWFDSATFKGDAWFHSATFKGVAWFHSATFKGDAWFHSATFKGDAWFHSATFKGDAWFHSATFKGDAWFDTSTWNATASFADSEFLAACDFTAIHSERAFGLAGAAFHCQVPRFIQAHFSESPRLDNLRLPYPARGANAMPQVEFRHLVDKGWKMHGYNCETRTGRFCVDYSKPGRLEKYEDFDHDVKPDEIHEGETWQLRQNEGPRAILRRRPYVPPIRPEGTPINEDDIAAYTALRKLALSAQDHEVERQAFKGELRSRRALSNNSGYRGFSWAYDFFTDFGASFLRPLALWAMVFVAAIFILPVFSQF